MQRSRLLAAAAATVDEEGYSRTTVARITERARVSRRTFYELFDDREACLDALIEDVVATIEGESSYGAMISVRSCMRATGLRRCSRKNARASQRRVV